MPTYEYACSACGIHLDVVQKMTEASLDTCAACGGKLRKVFHPAGILFKGSGFYATDNRSKPKTGTPSGSEKPEKSAEKSGKPTEKSEKSAERSSERPEKSAEKSGASSSSADGNKGSGNEGSANKGDRKPAKETA